LPPDLSGGLNIFYNKTLSPPIVVSFASLYIRRPIINSGNRRYEQV